MPRGLTDTALWPFRGWGERPRGAQGGRDPASAPEAAGAGGGYENELRISQFPTGPESRSRMAHLLLINDDPDLIGEQVRHAFPAPAHRVEVVRTGPPGANASAPRARRGAARLPPARPHRAEGV